MTVSPENSEQVRRASVIFADKHRFLFAFHGNQWWECHPLLRTWSRDGAYAKLPSYVRMTAEWLPAHEFPWVLPRLDQPWTVRQIISRASHLLTVPGLPGPGWTEDTPTSLPSQD